MFWRNIPLFKTAALTAASLLFAAAPASAQHHSGHASGSSHSGHHGDAGGNRPSHTGSSTHDGHFGSGNFDRHHDSHSGFHGLGVGVNLGYAYPYRSYGYATYPSNVGGYYTPGYYSDLGPIEGPYLAAPAATQAPSRPEAYQGANPDRSEDLVRSWYQKYLHREPDPQWAVWVDAVRNGQEPNAVLASILGSQEYYDKAGGTPERFVQTLYRDVTGRPPTRGEMEYWVRRANDRDRTDVAYGVLTR